MDQCLYLDAGICEVVVSLVVVHQSGQGSILQGEEQGGPCRVAASATTTRLPGGVQKITQPVRNLKIEKDDIRKTEVLKNLLYRISVSKSRFPGRDLINVLIKCLLTAVLKGTALR